MAELAAPAPLLLGRRSEGDRSGLGRTTVVLLALLLAVAGMLSLTSGATDAAFFDVLLDVVRGTDHASARDTIVILSIRLPRLVLGILVGAGLAVSGLLMQGLFRNPLADPGLVGVSSGAGLGAVSLIVLGGTALAPVAAILGIYAIQLAAFGGGLATTFILYRVANRNGQTAIATMLLAGIAIGALSGAITGMMVYVANDQQLRDLTFWGLGSLAGANWTKVLASAPIIVAALAASFLLRRGLNALTLGEASAHHLGVNVEWLKRAAIVTVAAATGASVAVSGGIGFVGIVVPHLLRLIIGPDHRYLLPASALLGATFLLAADAVSRTIVAPAELPIGIVTATVGGPFFLWVLLARRNRLAW